MSIREQRIDEDGVYIKFSDGSVFEKKKAELRTLSQREGTKVRALAALRGEMTGHGGEPSEITMDFRQADGAPLSLEWRAR